MGLGYIGLPTAIIAAKHGVQVTGVDINPKVVEMTNQGHLHIVEPGMEEMLQDVVRSGALHASTTPEVSDAYFMVVPTPFKGNHEPDISYVEAATRAVIPFLKEGDLYVIESTSPVGTTDKMAKLIFELRPELRGKIHIAYCPERVLPGNVIYELVHNDRVIGGMDEASTDKAIAFYSQFVQGTLHRLARRADCLRQRAVAHLRQGGHQRVGAHRSRQQASARQHPAAWMRSGRTLHCRRPILHHSRLPR